MLGLSCWRPDTPSGRLSPFAQTVPLYARSVRGRRDSLRLMQRALGKRPMGSWEIVPSITIFFSYSMSTLTTLRAGTCMLATEPFFRTMDTSVSLFPLLMSRDASVPSGF